MIFRRFKPEDEAQVRRIHEDNGDTFPFDSLNGSDFVSVWVAEDEGRIVSAVAARKVVEISAFVAHDWGNPAMRLTAMQELQQHGGLDLASHGFTQMQSWVNPEIRGFGRRLVRSMGWIPSKGGTCYVRGVPLASKIPIR